MSDPVFVPINRAVNDFGQCRRTIYELIALGRIKAVKAGRSTLVEYQSLKDYYCGRPPASFRPDARAKRHDEITANH
jgi:excisionase family DNA binding protein